jgi:hypothetical protein
VSDVDVVLIKDPLPKLTDPDVDLFFLNDAADDPAVGPCGGA